MTTIILQGRYSVQERDSLRDFLGEVDALGEIIELEKKSLEDIVYNITLGVLDLPWKDFLNIYLISQSVRGGVQDISALEKLTRRFRGAVQIIWDNPEREEEKLTFPTEENALRRSIESLIQDSRFLHGSNEFDWFVWDDEERCWKRGE